MTTIGVVSQAAQSPSSFSSYCDSQTCQVSPWGSPDGAVHHEVHCGAAWELSDGALLYGGVNLDLTHVCVPAVLVVGEYSDLDHEGADWLICSLKIRKSVNQDENATQKKKIKVNIKIHNVLICATMKIKT